MPLTTLLPEIAQVSQLIISPLKWNIPLASITIADSESVNLVANLRDATIENNMSDLTENSSASVPYDADCDLVIVSPRKIVFISRFLSNTSADSLIQFTRTLCKDLDESMRIKAEKNNKYIKVRYCETNPFVQNQ